MLPSSSSGHLPELIITSKYHWQSMMVLLDRLDLCLGHRVTYLYWNMLPFQHAGCGSIWVNDLEPVFLDQVVHRSWICSSSAPMIGGAKKLDSTIMLIDVSVIFPIKLPSFGDNSAFSDTPNHQLLSYQVVKEGLHMIMYKDTNSKDIY